MHIFAKNVFANVSTQLILILERICLVPLYLLAWGIQTYGTWIALSALPALFAVGGDFGIVPVAGNEMAIAFTKNDRQRVKALYKSVRFLVTCISITTLGIAATLLHVVGIERLLGGRLGTFSNIYLTAILLFFVMILNFQQGIQMSALRAIGYIAEATYLNNAIRVVQLAITVVALFMRLPPVFLAIVMVLMQISAIAASRLLLGLRAGWISDSTFLPDFSTLREIVPHALIFLAFPFGVAVVIQGFPVVINMRLGSKAVVTFVAVRTITRFLIQIVGIATYSAWPEITRHYGEGEVGSIARYYTHGVQIALAISVTMTVALSLFGGFFFSIWTGGQIQPSLATLLILSCAAAFEGLSKISETILIATNNFQTYAIIYFAATLLSLFLLYSHFVISILQVSYLLLALNVLYFLFSSVLALGLVGLGSRPFRDILSPSYNTQMALTYGSKFLDYSRALFEGILTAKKRKR